MQAKKAAVKEIQDQIDALGSTPTDRAKAKALSSKKALAVVEVAEAEEAVAVAESTADAASDGVKDDAERAKDNDEDDDAMPLMIIFIAAVVICGGAICLLVVARTRSNKVRDPFKNKVWVELVLPPLSNPLACA